MADLYDLRRWRRRSRLQLKMHPVCLHCERKGETTIAVLAHHNPPHGGDLYKLMNGPLESLCFEHHLIIHGRGAPRKAIGVDGWPEGQR